MRNTLPFLPVLQASLTLHHIEEKPLRALAGFLLIREHLAEMPQVHKLCHEVALREEKGNANLVQAILQVNCIEGFQRINGSGTALMQRMEAS